MQITGSSQADLIEYATEVDDSIGNNGTLRVDSERPSHPISGCTRSSLFFPLVDDGEIR
jgi:hypothetical protein